MSTLIEANKDYLIKLVQEVITERLDPMENPELKTGGGSYQDFDVSASWDKAFNKAIEEYKNLTDGLSLEEKWLLTSTAPETGRSGEEFERESGSLSMSKETRFLFTRLQSTEINSDKKQSVNNIMVALEQFTDLYGKSTLKNMQESSLQEYSSKIWDFLDNKYQGKSLSTNLDKEITAFLNFRGNELSNKSFSDFYLDTLENLNTKQVDAKSIIRVHSAAKIAKDKRIREIADRWIMGISLAAMAITLLSGGTFTGLGITAEILAEIIIYEMLLPTVLGGTGSFKIVGIDKEQIIEKYNKLLNKIPDSAEAPTPEELEQYFVVKSDVNKYIEEYIYGNLPSGNRAKVLDAQAIGLDVDIDYELPDAKRFFSTKSRLKKKIIKERNILQKILRDMKNPLEIEVSLKERLEIMFSGPQTLGSKITRNLQKMRSQMNENKDDIPDVNSRSSESMIDFEILKVIYSSMSRGTKGQEYEAGAGRGDVEYLISSFAKAIRGKALSEAAIQEKASKLAVKMWSTIAPNHDRWAKENGMSGVTVHKDIKKKMRKSFNLLMHLPLYHIMANENRTLTLSLFTDIGKSKPQPAGDISGSGALINTFFKMIQGGAIGRWGDGTVEAKMESNSSIINEISAACQKKSENMRAVLETLEVEKEQKRVSDNFNATRRKFLEDYTLFYDNLKVTFDGFSGETADVEVVKAYFYLSSTVAWNSIVRASR